jgi:hypothetical protein
VQVSPLTVDTHEIIRGSRGSRLEPVRHISSHWTSTDKAVALQVLMHRYWIASFVSENVIWLSSLLVLELGKCSDDQFLVPDCFEFDILRELILPDTFSAFLHKTRRKVMRPKQGASPGV